MRKKTFACAECGVVVCDMGESASCLRGCPSSEPDRSEVVALYREDKDRRLACNAALVEARGYCQLTLLEEIMDFARRCGFLRLGLAFCIGGQKEARVVSRVLRAHGFTVDSAARKNAALPKEEHRAQSAAGPGCRLRQPVHAALGRAVTVFAAKDGVLAHNPLAAVCLADSYYHDRLYPGQEAPPLA